MNFVDTGNTGYWFFVVQRFVAVARMNEDGILFGIAVADGKNHCVQHLWRIRRFGMGGEDSADRKFVFQKLQTTRKFLWRCTMVKHHPKTFIYRIACHQRAAFVVEDGK